MRRRISAFIIAAAVLLIETMQANAASSSELRKLILDEKRFNKPSVLLLHDDDSPSTITKARENANSIAHYIQTRPPQGIAGLYDKNLAIMPITNWSSNVWKPESSGDIIWGPESPESKFLAKNGFIEVIAVEVPSETITGKFEVSGHFYAFYVSATDKLRARQVQIGRKKAILLGKRKVKTISHEHKTNISYYFEFTYTIEPLFPKLPSLGPYKGVGEAIYNEITGRWDTSLKTTEQEEYGYNKSGETDYYGYGKWFFDNYRKEPLTILKYYKLEPIGKNTQETLSPKITRKLRQFPSHTGYLNDFAGIINTEKVSELEEYLKDLEKKTTSEVMVVTVSDLGSYNRIEDYSLALFNDWGIGKKGLDNGVLILLALKERQIRIEVGKGLENVITNDIAAEIIQDIMIPHMKTGDYGGGLTEGANKVGNVIIQSRGWK